MTPWKDRDFLKPVNKSIMNRREEAISMGRVEATYVDPTEPTDEIPGVEPRVDGYRSMNESGRRPLAEYNVMIKQVNNGFFVEVGCQAFVFKTFAELTQLLTEYYANPQGVTEKFYQGTLF